MYQIKEEYVDTSKMPDEGKFKLNKSGILFAAPGVDYGIIQLSVKNRFVKVVRKIKGIKINVSKRNVKVKGQFGTPLRKRKLGFSLEIAK